MIEIERNGQRELVDETCLEKTELQQYDEKNVIYITEYRFPNDTTIVRREVRIVPKWWWYRPTR